jgi:hypothetical protein
MSDPAIKAASRACEGTGLKPRLPSASEVAAAREALKPVQKWHRRLADAYSLDDRPIGVLIRSALDELVQLIYPESEW